MSNEPLGIYEELRARAERYSDLGRLRRQLVNHTTPANGAYAQPLNPFIRYLRNRVRVMGGPVAPNSRGSARHRLRTVWPEAELGISLATVIKTVIDESETTGWQMFSADQHWRVSRPRQVAMYMADRYCPGYSLPQIGFIFSRDHTTIMAGIEAVTIRLLNKDPLTVDLVAKSHARLRELAA